jgi:hypothetical protein
MSPRKPIQHHRSSHNRHVRRFITRRVINLERRVEQPHVPGGRDLSGRPLAARCSGSLLRLDPFWRRADRGTFELG